MPEGSTGKAKNLVKLAPFVRCAIEAAQRHSKVKVSQYRKGLFQVRGRAHGARAEFSLHNLPARNWLGGLAGIRRPLPDVTKFHCETTYRLARGGKTAPKDTKPKGFSP
jgi:hypothetical protein